MKTQLIDYQDGNDLLEGFFAFDDRTTEKKPGVILCHAWSGKDEFICDRAKDIAKLGYSAFALDIYGKGKIGHNKQENLDLMSPFMADRAFLKRRLLAALKTFNNLPQVDIKRISVMGYCFGGLCALDLARSGADIKGAISIHGLLEAPENIPSEIKAKVLALHGFKDPLVEPEEVAAFEREMEREKVDWQLYIYGQAMHAFTNPLANDPDFGTVYNPLASKRSWKAIQNFLTECLLEV